MDLRRIVFAFVLTFAPLTGCTTDDPGSMVNPSQCSGDQGGAAYDPEAAAGSIGFMDECDVSNQEQCASGQCKFFNHAGKAFCTKACTTEADCPCPSTECNMKGQCKAPRGL